MQRNFLVLSIVIVVVAIMIFAGVHAAHQQRYAAYENAAGGKDDSIPAGDVKGKAAPDFTLNDLDERPVKLSDFRGKAVLLNFWATWCGPCRIEMPWFVDFQKQYGPQGLQIVGIAMDDSGKDAVVKFTKEMNVNYVVLQGKEAIGDAYGGIPGLPTTFFIDRNGKIVDVAPGLVSRSEIEDAIKKSLAAPADAKLQAKGMGNGEK